MVQVQIQLYATLRAHVAGKSSLDADIDPGQSIEQVLRQIGVPPEKARLVFVNDRSATLDQRLSGGERVAAFPAIGGG